MTRAVVKIMGGLGNQLFQYALARGLCKHYDEVALDISFFKHAVDRKFQLGDMKTVLPISNGKENFTFRYDEPHFTYSQEALQCYGESVLYTGYFQSWKYLECSKSLLLDEIHPKTKIETINLDHCCAVHIRRGDYATKKVMSLIGILEDEYYEAAMNASIRKNFFFFGDEGSQETIDRLMKYARSRGWLARSVSELYPTITDCEELEFMSQCGDKIIANSTFSWWAAWLGGGNIFAPTKWFMGELSKTCDTRDLLPPEWRKM